MAASTSGYAAAFMGVSDLLTGASKDAAYEAAYGKFYSAFQGMHNAANQKVAAEANISAIQQDRINTNIVIARHQDQAEAQAKVSAAVSGVEGQSVNDVIYQTEVSSSVAKSNNKKNAEQQIENQLSTVYQSTSTMLALDNASVSSPSLARSLATSAASMVGLGDELMDGMSGLFGVESSGEADLAINYQTPDNTLQLS